MKLRLSPLPDADNGSYGFGAQVHGVDVAAVAQQASGGEDGGIRATMLQAMREHGLLLFRGQKELEPEEQLAFAKIFPWDMTASPDRLSLQSRHGQAFIPAVPEVVVQGHGVVPAGHYGLPAGELRQTQDHWQWHADGLHQLITPPVHTQMYCTVAPERGGATGFVSAHEAWDRLPPRLKSKASGLRARYQTVAHPMSVCVENTSFSSIARFAVLRNERC
jgi:taurine dioxygenase